jgi:putative acetyltransferase
MEMIIKPVLPTNRQVVALIEKLNHYQIGLYGIESCNLETPESLEKNNAYMLGAYLGEHLAGIGAVKLFDKYAEIKRMYVEDHYRGLSVAESILTRLEAYARQNGVYKIFLETGNLHHAAIRFYTKSGYREVESFGHYKPNNVSVYFGKVLEIATSPSSYGQRGLIQNIYSYTNLLPLGSKSTHMLS